MAGLVLGAIVGVLYSFRGGTTYKATALISLGQPTSPGGVLVNGFGTNPRAISLIVSSAAAQAQAANRADMRPAALRGHVSVAQVGTVTGAGGGAGDAADRADRHGLASRRPPRPQRTSSPRSSSARRRRRTSA